MQKIICAFCKEEYDAKSKKSKYCSRSCKEKYARSKKEAKHTPLQEIITILENNKDACNVIHQTLTESNLIISVCDEDDPLRFLEMGSKHWVEIIHHFAKEYPLKPIIRQEEIPRQIPVTKNYIKQFEGLEFPEEYKNLWDEISVDQNMSAKDKAQWKIKLNIK